MVLYIAFIASLNLCVGYVLGVYVGVLPGVARRDQDQLEEGPIGLDSPASDSSAAVKPEPAKLPEKPASSKLVETKVEEAPDMSPPAPPTEAGSPPASKTEDILAGLTAFRDQLASAGKAIRESGEDRESVDACAGELKKANDNYLEKAHEVIDAIDAEEESSTSDENLMLKESLVEQTDTIENANARIDEILTDDDPAHAREKLIESADQLEASAAGYQDALLAAPETTISLEESLAEEREDDNTALHDDSQLVEQEALST